MEGGSSSGREPVGEAVHGKGLGEGLAAPVYLGTGYPVPLGTRGALYPRVWLLLCSARGMCVIIVADLLFLQFQLSKRCWEALSSVSGHPLPSHPPR